MRTVSGEIALPNDFPKARGADVLIEVRDVSLVDAPSIVVAHTTLKDVDLKPSGSISFSLPVPEVPDARSLEIRIHISLDKSDIVKRGDLLTTMSHQIPSRGSFTHMVVPVKRI
jgi:putative lipoprotein